MHPSRTKKLRYTRKSYTRGARPLRVETLERRNLLTVDVVPGNFTDYEDDRLQIIGTDGPDVVWVVTAPSRDSVWVVENGVLHDVREPFDHIYFEGGDGEDTFINATSIPSIATGGADDDRLYGGTSVNLLAGGDGNDQIYGRGVHNEIWGDAVMSDYSLPHFREGYVWGTEPGNDTIQGGPEINVIYGGAGDDFIQANGETANLLIGEAGDDVLIGSTGYDRISGGSGDDLLRGGSGKDWLYGDSGNDILLGGDDADMLWGGDGRDLLIGGAGRDDLYGSEWDTLGFLPGPRGYEPGDILVEGTTAYDDNDEALMAILNEWVQPTSRESRIANLQRGVGPLGLYALNDRTVVDDGDTDTLGGIGEGDWIVGRPIRPWLHPLF